MKKFRKIIILLLFILSITYNVYATDNIKGPSLTTAKLTMNTNTKLVNVGETIKISLKASYENGIDGINSVLEYNKTKLELTNVEMKNYFGNQSGEDAQTGEFILTALYGELGAPQETPKEAEYMVLTFKVLDTVTYGETLSIKLSDIEIIDPTLNSVPVESQGVTFTVKEEKSEEEQEPNKEDKDTTEQKQEDAKKDDTVANKVINKAGINKHAIIVIIAIMAIIRVLYIKNKKNSDIY